VQRDPHAHLKDNAWRELAEIDERLGRGEIGEEGWYEAVSALIVPAYLAGDTPWEQSGKSGDRAGWEYARSLISDAIDCDGTFLDVGCANGYLMETLPRWSSRRIEPYGLDISPELVALARERLPRWGDRIAVGNALTWQSKRRFTYVRTGLDYVPPGRRPELVAHLLGLCERLIVGVFNEHERERTTEESLGAWGFAIAGRTARPHARHAGMEYRAVWLDADANRAGTR
jgi:SAM-dependent methyltransferase